MLAACPSQNDGGVLGNMETGRKFSESCFLFLLNSTNSYSGGSMNLEGKKSGENFEGKKLG